MPEGDSSAFDAAAHLSRLANGSVLLARDLSDPNFASTVVLLCQIKPQGAYGLVLNRPSHMPLGEIFENPPESALLSSKKRRVYIGGPVQATELQILQIGEPFAPGSQEIAPDIRLGGSWNDLNEFLSQDSNSIRMFLGYSGWSEGQLEHEVEQGAWEVLTPNVKKLLLAPEEAWFTSTEDFRKFVASL